MWYEKFLKSVDRSVGQCGWLTGCMHMFEKNQHLAVRWLNRKTCAASNFINEDLKRMHQWQTLFMSFFSFQFKTKKKKKLILCISLKFTRVKFSFHQKWLRKFAQAFRLKQRCRWYIECWHFIHVIGVPVALANGNKCVILIYENLLGHRCH